MKKFVFFVFILLSISIIPACKTANSNETANTTPTPIPDKNAPKDAIVTFLTSKYPGWKLEGDTLDKKFDDAVQFDIHLQKDKEDKIITVILKKFQDLEGQSYWVLYEPTKLEIAQARLKQLKIDIGNSFREESISYSLDGEPYDTRR